MINRLAFIFSILIFSSFVSCNSSSFDVDVSKINLNVKIQRLEKDLFSIDPDSLQYKIPVLAQKYDDFFDLYTTSIISIGRINEITFLEYLKKFLVDYNMYKDYQAVVKLYPNLSELEEKLELAFRHYKYYFPEKNTPKVFTGISGFNHSIATDSLNLGIFLDKYLGQKHEFYKLLGTPEYMRKRMNPENIVPDCMTAIAQRDFEFKDSLNNLLSNVIQQGKLIYYTKSMIPTLPDTLLFCYTKKQLKWAEAYENKVWKYIIEKKQLFSTNRLDISKYINDAPFTTFFANNSAPRAGVFVGYKIVKKYMDKTEATLPELMMEKDCQMILQKSAYNP